MSSAPLVGARGEPLSTLPGPEAEILRPQASPFPQLAGVVLTRIRPARNALPEDWRFTLVLRLELGGKGAAFNLDLAKGAKARELARTLRQIAGALDSLTDQIESRPDASGSPQVHPTPRSGPV